MVVFYVESLATSRMLYQLQTPAFSLPIAYCKLLLLSSNLFLQVAEKLFCQRIRHTAQYPLPHTCQ